MRIYLDMCCLKRPFDDQSDARIQLETTALAAILVVCNRGEHELFTSDALRFENSRNPNPERQEFAERVLAQATHDIRHDSALEQRASVWQNAGIELLRRAVRVAANLRVLSLLDLFKEIVP